MNIFSIFVLLLFVGEDIRKFCLSNLLCQEIFSKELFSYSWSYSRFFLKSNTIDLVLLWWRRRRESSPTANGHIDRFKTHDAAKLDGLKKKFLSVTLDRVRGTHAWMMGYNIL